MIIEKGETQTTITMSNADAQRLRDILGLTCYDTARRLADGDEEGEKLIDAYLTNFFFKISEVFPNSTFDF